jgi:predicted RNase H-like nuclease (RuvC/YqgF family)
MADKTIKFKNQEPGTPERPVRSREIEITETDTVTKTTITTLQAINEEDRGLTAQIEALRAKRDTLRAQKAEIKATLNINNEEK